MGSGGDVANQRHSAIALSPWDRSGFQGFLAVDGTQAPGPPVPTPRLTEKDLKDTDPYPENPGTMP